MSIFPALDYPCATTSKKKQEPCFRSEILLVSIKRSFCHFEQGGFQKQQGVQEEILHMDHLHALLEMENQMLKVELQRLNNQIVDLSHICCCHLNCTDFHIHQLYN